MGNDKPKRYWIFMFINSNAERTLSIISIATYEKKKESNHKHFFHFVCDHLIKFIRFFIQIDWVRERLTLNKCHLRMIKGFTIEDEC